MARGSKVTGRDLVARGWPMDGPYSAERAAEAARAMGELVRYLAYATRPKSTLAHPVDVNDMLSGLAIALYSFGQVCGQVGVTLDGHAGLPGLALDGLHPVTDEDGASTVAERAADAMRAASAAAYDLSSYLSLAHANVGRLRVEVTGGGQ